MQLNVLNGCDDATKPYNVVSLFMFALLVYFPITLNYQYTP